MKNILFLDIDGVLNGVGLHKLLDDAFVGEQHFSFEKLKEIDLGNVVSFELSSKLAEIVKRKNVIVVGLSAWFTRAYVKARKNDNFQQELNLISQCLGFEIKDTTSSNSGADFRLKTSVEWLEKNIQENEKVNAIFLDDDIRFKEDNITDYKIFNDKYNGIIISPRYDGISENQFKQIDKWFE